MLFAYPKNKQENISAEQTRILRNFVDEHLKLWTILTSNYFVRAFAKQARSSAASVSLHEHSHSPITIQKKFVSVLAYPSLVLRRSWAWEFGLYRTESKAIAILKGQLKHFCASLIEIQKRFFMRYKLDQKEKEIWASLLGFRHFHRHFHRHFSIYYFKISSNTPKIFLSM